MMTPSRISRRDLLGLGATTLAAQVTTKPKRVVVIGAGIAGLSCAYELVRRGHDVMVLEAAGRTGGHVRTLSDPFADGLYADVGAEHFYYPGYTPGAICRSSSSRLCPIHGATT